jgi:hypothetical protein
MKKHTDFMCNRYTKVLTNSLDRLKEAGLEMPIIMDMLFQLKQRGVNIIVKRWSVNAVVVVLLPTLPPSRTGRYDKRM